MRNGFIYQLDFFHFSNYFLKLCLVIVTTLRASVSFSVLSSTGLLNYFKMLEFKSTWSQWVRNLNRTLQECLDSIL